MTTTRLRKKIHEYVDQADHDFLELLDQLLHDHLMLKQPGVVLTPEDLEEIELRKKSFLDGTDKGMDAATSVKKLRELLKK